MTNIELERLVLHHVSRPNYCPVKPRTIAKQLKLPKTVHADLKKAVKRLVKQGKLSYGSNHLVQPVGTSTKDLITGVFQRTSGGYGFVRPSGTNRSAGKADDIYIPPQSTLDASTGDVVLVRRKQRSRGAGQRRAGEITEVIERETHQFVGTYFEDAGAGYVRLDGSLFSQPILVGDAGAKHAQVGDKVVIEMVRFPSHAHAGEGVVTEVLGDLGKPGVDTLLVMREFDLPEKFPDDVLEDARQQAELFDGKIGEDRTDLTKATVITIDPKDARDFDDAVSLERLANGHWRLGIHIADVSHFVRPKSPLDREARRRATSVYLLDRVIPMLPEAISNNLASLQPRRVRYARTAFIEFTADGARVSTETCASAIKSKRRFTYEEIDDFLADRAKWQAKLRPEVVRLLDDMYQLAMILRRRRREHGALELTLPEIRLDMDRKGQVRGAVRVENTESHQIIEEFMLAANEAVAESIRDRKLYFLRRIHENPSPLKLNSLTEFIRELNIPCVSLESRFEIQRVLAEVADTPQRDAVNYAVLRSMQKAMYSPQDHGHYALASECYCHFTSPIRRYPDLTVHRILHAVQRGKPVINEYGALLSLGEHCSDREQRAEAAERELKKLKLLNYLSTRIGAQMEAVITGVESFGLFVQGLELPAEGLVHVSSLADDYYDYDMTTHTLAGRRAGNCFRLGDALRVEIAHVDLDRRQMDLRLVKKLDCVASEKEPTGKTTKHSKPSRHGQRSQRRQATKKSRPSKTQTQSKKTVRKKKKATKPTTSGRRRQ